MLQSMFDTHSSRPGEVTVRDIPPFIMRRLRTRAIDNKRPLQDEVYSILEAAVLLPHEAPQR